MLNFFLFMLLFILLSCGEPFNQKKMYGVWRGENKNKILTLKFNRNGKCDFILNDISSDQEETFTGIYEIDLLKSPVPLTIYDVDQLNHPLHTIIKFTNDNSITLARFAPQKKLRQVIFNKHTDIKLNRFNQIFK